ncbi:MAG TPA: UrcA family protein [Caulobacteraceae bacterium]|nr:UrcA family protein [Caulobacteraceae bacterium]
MTRTMLTAGLVALILGGVVSRATADDRIVTETGVVMAWDLDLATQQGARTLVRRVAAKAGDLCAQPVTPRSRGAEQSWRACVAQAVAASVAGLNAPLVTAEYTRAFGAPPTVVAAR